MTPDLRGKPKTGKTTGGEDHREVHYHDMKYNTWKWRLQRRFN